MTSLRFLPILCLLLFAGVVPALGQGQGTVAVLATVADMTNRPPSALNPTVVVLGYRTNGDWGAPRTIQYTPTSTATIDNGCVFPTSTGTGRWIAGDCDGGEVDVRYFLSGNPTNDSPAFQAAFNSGASLVKVPAGTFAIRTDLTITNTVRVVGPHKDLAILRYYGTNIALSIGVGTNSGSGPRGIQLENLFFIGWADPPYDGSYAPSNAVALIKVSGATRGAIKDVRISNAMTGSGILFDRRAWYWDLQNLMLFDLYAGVNFQCPNPGSGDLVNTINLIGGNISSCDWGILSGVTNSPSGTTERGIATLRFLNVALESNRQGGMWLNQTEVASVENYWEANGRSTAGAGTGCHVRLGNPTDTNAWSVSAITFSGNRFADSTNTFEIYSANNITIDGNDHQGIKGNGVGVQFVTTNHFNVRIGPNEYSRQNSSDAYFPAISWLEGQQSSVIQYKGSPLRGAMRQENSSGLFGDGTGSALLTNRIHNAGRFLAVNSTNGPAEVSAQLIGQVGFPGVYMRTDGTEGVFGGMFNSGTMPLALEMNTTRYLTLDAIQSVHPNRWVIGDTNGFDKLTVYGDGLFGDPTTYAAYTDLDARVAVVSTNMADSIGLFLFGADGVNNRRAYIKLDLSVPEFVLGATRTTGGEIPVIIRSGLGNDIATFSDSGMTLRNGAGINFGGVVRTNWPGGDVVGPASSTDSVVALYDGTTGKLLKNGTLTEAAIATDAEVAAAYQPLDSDLTAVAGLASNGLVARTGSGTVSARTITGDSEISVTNGDGVSGNPTLAIGSAIARLASPALTGNPTGPTASPGDNDTSLATTAFVTAAVAAGGGGGGGGGLGTNLIVNGVLHQPAIITNSASVTWATNANGHLQATASGGGGGGDAYLANTQTFTGDNTFTGDVIVGALTASSFSTATPIGISSGGTGGGTAAAARTNLGVIPDVDVQTYRLSLLQAHTALASDGDMIYRNSSGIVTNITSTAPGRALLSAATALAQRNALEVGKLSQTGHSGAWDGVTNESPTLDAVYDVIAALPGGSNSIVSWNTDYFDVSGGYLDWVGGSTGGGGVTWIGTSGIGAFTNVDTSTNVSLAAFTISSNDVPTTEGRYLVGETVFCITNNSGGTINFHLTAKLNGTPVFSAQRSVSTATTLEWHVGRFRLAREAGSAATLYWDAERFGGTVPSIGSGGSFSASSGGSVGVVTNLACTWTTNITLSIEMGQISVSGATNTAAGVQRIAASLYNPGSGSSSGGGGTGDVVGPASSTDSVVALWDGTTGKLLKNGTLTESAIATDAEVAAAYQPLDADLTDLADGSLTGSKVGTGIDGGNITAGTVADARIDTAIARLASPALSGNPTAPTASPGDNDTSVATTAFVTAAVAAGGGGGGGLGTNLVVNGVLRQPAIITNSATVTWTTNGNGHIEASAITVTNLPVSGLWQTLGSFDFIATITGTEDGTLTFTNFSGVVTNAGQIGNDGSGHRIQLQMSFREPIGTNYLIFYDFDGADDEDSGFGVVAWAQSSARSSTSCEVSIVDNGTTVFSSDGWKGRIRIVNPNATAGGQGGDVVGPGSSTDSRLALWDGTTGKLLKTGTLTEATIAPLASPALTGNPTAPTPASGDNDTSVATTAFVTGAVADATPYSMAEQSEESFTPFVGSTTTTAGNPFTLAAINGGTTGTQSPVLGRSGLVKINSASTAYWSGGVAHSGANSIGLTNVYSWKAEFHSACTNGVTQTIGFGDSTSTNAFTDGLYLAITNGTAYFSASEGGTVTTAGTSFAIPTNTFISAVCRGTNEIAVIALATNGVAAWSEAINSANIPLGSSAVGVNVRAFVTSGAFTNAADLIILNYLGHRASTR